MADVRPAAGEEAASKKRKLLLLIPHKDKKVQQAPKSPTNGHHDRLFSNIIEKSPSIGRNLSPTTTITKSLKVNKMVTKSK